MLSIPAISVIQKVKRKKWLSISSGFEIPIFVKNYSKFIIFNVTYISTVNLYN